MRTPSIFQTSANSFGFSSVAVIDKVTNSLVVGIVALSCAQLAIHCATANVYSQESAFSNNTKSATKTTTSTHGVYRQHNQRNPVVHLTQHQVENAIQYLDSSDRQHQIHALESLKRFSPNELLASRVKSIAEKSPDAIVQGHARLLAADWGLTVDHNSVIDLSNAAAFPTEATSTEIAPKKQSVNANDQVVVNMNDQPVATQHGNAIGNTHFETDGSTQRFGQRTIGYSFSDSQAQANWLPSSPFTGTSDSETRQVSPPSLFSIQTPFWADNAPQGNSLPSDVEKHQELPEIQIQSNYPYSQVQFQYARMQQEHLANQNTNDIRPNILNREIDAANDPILKSDDSDIFRASYFDYLEDAPLGYTGPSGVMLTEFQRSDHFVPIEDRWRLGFPKWDRYGKGHPVLDDYPFKEGSLLDPYNQNVLKGDYPIIGQHIFYTLTVDTLIVHEYRQTPTATTPFESTADPFSAGFFGSPDQYFYTPFLRIAFELFHGNEAFKPVDWKLRFVPILNFNFLDVDELAIVNPDVRRGTDRYRDDAAFEEWFLEGKLADIGPDYDFVSARIGSQFFVSDFRGFVFKDINRGVRLFGTRLSNRDQFNAVWFDQAEKDTNSELNNFDDRHQNVVVFNYFRQDFVFPGYVAQASFHYNQDKPSVKFDDNDNLVRPDPVGVFKPHEVDAYYFGLAGDGHIGRINISNQFYVVQGEDSANPIAGRAQDINAYMAALELSYDRDWIRFRTSYFFASGDDDPNDGQATGFDTILDDPIFAGGEFSYWQRQSIRLFGTNLVQRKSIVPNLRSSKIQGQSNFVNPGLHLFNLGTDLELTPKTRAIANANYLFFDQTEVLETYTFQNKIDSAIGADLSLGIEHRPLLNDNAIILIGIATLIPAQGLQDLFGTELPGDVMDIGVGSELRDETPRLTSAFVELVLAY